MATSYPDKQRYTETNTSDMLTYIGQFFDHDFDKTKDGSGSEAAPIPIPRGDPYFDPTGTGNKTMPFTRSAYAQPNSSSVRSPINLITAFIDGSLVYGSSDAVAAALRSGVGGRLRVANDSSSNASTDWGVSAQQLGSMLPLVQSVNISMTYMANDANRVPAGSLRAAGDVRGNVDPPVLAFQTLWVREHNRLAGELAKQHPEWDDETLFQEARKWNIAYLQNVCYNEYIPALGIILPTYKGYNVSVNPSIDVFFSTVSYRYGHSEITDIILRIDDEGNEIPQGHLLLSQTYFNPPLSLSAGIDPVLRGLAMRVQGYVEPRFSTAVQNFLFGLPGVNGTDLFARNIQRGRDHGVPDYNSCRVALGLKPLASFKELTNDTTLVNALTKLYGTPDKCDAYVCGLAERKLPDSHFGPLFNASLTDQYLRVRDGDWYYWENALTGAFNESEMDDIRNTSLRAVILRNTDIKTLPIDLWRVDTEQPWPRLQSAGSGGEGAAAAATQGQANQQQVSLANGAYKLGWSFPPGTDSVEFTVTVQGKGWVGLGVPASADPTTAMVNADIVMARVASDGTAAIDDMWSTAFAPPQKDTDLGGASNVELVNASEANGVTTITFRRPLAATDPKYDRAISPDKSNTLIFAWNPDTDDITQYHGPDHRGVATVPLYSSAGAAGSEGALVAEELGSSGDAYRTLGSHGILMTVAFAMLLPLAAFANRAKNTAFLAARPRARQALFYAHIVLNFSATLLVAAALGLVFSRLSYLDFEEVPYSHGQLGIAVATLLFVQALYPWLRPSPVPLTAVRRVWELIHTTLGRAIIALGLVNVAIGIHIITSMFGGDLFFFAAMAATPVGALLLLGSVMDRLSWQSSQRALINEHATAIAAGEERDSPGEHPASKATAAP